MPSFSQDINVNINSNESGVVENGTKVGSSRSSPTETGVQVIVTGDMTPMEQRQLAIDLRDFLAEPETTGVSKSPSPLEWPLPYIDELEGALSDEERQAGRDTEDVLTNAACRLRRWRAASRKLRRPRNIDKPEDASTSGGTDMSARLRSLAAAGSMSASTGELLSLAPPPPAATAPPSPSALLTPSLAEQSAHEYFGSSPECCTEVAILGDSTSFGAPIPPPGPRYKLATEGSIRVCSFQHTRTVVDKILAAKFLRRWETHVLCLQEDQVVSKTPSGLLERPLAYSCMQEVYRISRWDPARKYCLRIVMPQGSLLLQANDAYTRDEWYHSILWRRNIIKYRKVLTKSNKKEIVLKELKNMVDFAMTTPLQDEVVTRAPLQLLTDLLSEDKDGKDWEEWAESATSVAGPLLAERCASGELCALLARLCRRRPRVTSLPALAPPVRRVLTRNVDFARSPHARSFVRDYISALSAHSSGASLVRRFVEVTHGNRAVCPRPRAAPNLAAVALAALDEHYRENNKLPHVCSETEEEVLCFADILAHMCEYEDWIVIVAGVLHPVPLRPTAMQCPKLANTLAKILALLSRDPRCIVHSCVAPAKAARTHPPSWLKVAGPAETHLALPKQELCQLWGNMLGSVLNCCLRRKSFLQTMINELPDFVIAALSEDPAAIDALCLMLEWEVSSSDQTQLEMIATLQATDSGQKSYRELCERQKDLQRLQAVGGPKKLALPVRATDADVAALLETGALGNLEYLSLAFTSVTSECAHHIIKLPSLRYLNLWATQFGDSGVQIISEHLPRLQVLNLCETPVSDKGIEALSALPNLRRLNLNSTKLTSEAFEYLKKRLPQLKNYDIRYTEAW